MRLPDQDQPFAVDARVPLSSPIADPAKASVLRSEWSAMTDTHQFMALTRKLKMNRLGAYHIVGAPFVRKLEIGAVSAALEQCAAGAMKMMVFVGNPGCIQIHSGVIETIKPMGPWQNVLDPRFNLHLRRDHIAEVWLVNKPTKRCPAISVEAFDAQGELILQLFGKRAETDTETHDWGALTKTLRVAEEVAA